jgi:hypothetical protein
MQAVGPCVEFRDVIGTWLNASELFGEGKYQARHFERMILHIKMMWNPLWVVLVFESILFNPSAAIVSLYLLCS